MVIFMGLLDKLKFGAQGFDGDEDYETDDYGYDEDEGYAPAPQQPEVSKEPVRSMAQSVNVNGALELKVVKPERFDSVPQIADHLLNKRTVVLNLEATNKETARRLIDFLSGVAYSIDGQMKKVAANTYVITPANVDVTGEPLKEKEDAPKARDEYSEV